MNKNNMFSEQILLRNFYSCDNDNIKFILKYNKENNIHYNFCKKDIYNIIFNSCRENNLLTTKLLMEQESTFDVIQNDNYLIRKLSKIDNNEFIKWFHQNYPGIDFNSNDHEAFFNSCYTDNNELINYIHKNCNDKLNIYKNNNELLKNICKQSKKNTFIFLSYLFDKPIPIDPSFNDVNRVEKLFFFLCRYNYIEFAKLYKRFHSFDVTESNNEAICLAVQENHFELVKWIYSQGGNIKTNDNWCFKVSLDKKHYNILDWIISLNVIDLNYNNENLFRYACAKSPLESIKWLYNKTNIDIHARGDEAFVNSCILNRLDVVKWLYEIGTFDLSFNENLLFNYVINFGNLDVAKWIYSKIEVDIHNNDEFLFRLACNNNHIEIAKWIYSLGNVNIKAFGNHAFRIVCQSNFVDIAKWLHELNSNEYYLVIEDGNIKEWKISKTIEINYSKFVDEIIDCPICFVNKSEIITDCNHMYCINCFKAFAESRTESFEDLNCPMCRHSNMVLFKVKLNKN